MRKKCLAIVLFLLTVSVILMQTPVRAAMTCTQYGSLGLVDCQWTAVSGAVEYLFTASSDSSNPTIATTSTTNSIRISADWIKGTLPSLCSDNGGIITFIATPCAQSGSSCDPSKWQWGTLDYRFACAPETCTLDNIECSKDATDWECDIDCSGSDHDYCYAVIVGGNFYEFLDHDDYVDGLVKDLPCGSTTIKAYAADCDNRRYDSSKYESDSLSRTCSHSPACNNPTCAASGDGFDCTISCSDQDSDLDEIRYGLTNPPTGQVLFNNNSSFALPTQHYTCSQVGYGTKTFSAFAKDSEGSQSSVLSTSFNCIDTSCHPTTTLQCKDGNIYSNNSCTGTSQIVEECRLGCSEKEDVCYYKELGEDKGVPENIALTGAILSFLAISNKDLAMKDLSDRIKLRPVPPSNAESVRCDLKTSGFVGPDISPAPGIYICTSFAAENSERDPSRLPPCWGELSGKEPHYHFELYLVTDKNRDAFGKPILLRENMIGNFHLSYRPDTGCFYFWVEKSTRNKVKEDYCKKICLPKVKNIAKINPWAYPSLTSFLAIELAKSIKESGVDITVPALMAGFQASLAPSLAALTTLVEANAPQIIGALEEYPAIGGVILITTGIIAECKTGDLRQAIMGDSSNPRRADYLSPSRIANDASTKSFLYPNVSNDQILSSEPNFRKYAELLEFSTYLAIWILSEGGENIEK